MRLYIYIYTYESGFWGPFSYPGSPHAWSWGFLDRLEMNWCIRRLIGSVWHPQNRSRISKRSSDVPLYWFHLSVHFHDFEGYEKDADRYLESICTRTWAWALFWTCLVKETMFFKYWQLSARRRAWKSKPNLIILATWALQEFKGPILMFYIYIYISIYASSASMHLCIYTSTHPCIHASMHLCIYASIHPCIYVSIYLSICL